MPVTKHCKHCKEDKHLDLFQKDISRIQGVRPECKECTSKARKKRYSVDATRKHNLDAKYGEDSISTYSNLFKEQEGVCAICKQAENGRYKHLSVDHCHTSLKIRGLLCNNCNRGIGLLQENKEILQNAVEYLTK